MLPATMIQDTLAKIETRIGQSGVKAESKTELLTLLATLKSEVAELAKTHGDAAQSISGFTQISAHEATRSEPNPTLVKHSLDGLAASVDGFEQSHPRLVAIVNRFCTTLSNLGI